MGAITYIHLKTISSTQDLAKKAWKKDLSSKEKILCITAEKQTKGRGKPGRPWLSEKGNLFATYAFFLKKATKDLTCLAQMLSLSLVKLLQKKGLSPKVKWPNDVLLSGKKLAGILCEASLEEEGYQIFLGLGVNLNLDAPLVQKIDQKATSLWLETKKKEDPILFLEELQPFFLQDLACFKKEGFSYFHQEYESLLAYKGIPISCKTENTLYQGICEGVTSKGALKLRMEDNSIKEIYSADIFC